MDPVTMSVVTGIVANGLWAMIAQALGRIGGWDRHTKDAPKALEKAIGLSTILQRAEAAAARKYKVSDKDLSDRGKKFLVSPEVEAIVRQIYAAHLGSGHAADMLEELKAEFVESYFLHTREDADEGRPQAQALFEFLIKTCDEALQTCIDNGILSAHEAKSAARHARIQDELAAIKKNMKILDSKPDVQAILAFEEKLRDQVRDQHRHIYPADLDRELKVAIDELYVAPTFTVRLRVATADEERPSCYPYLAVHETESAPFDATAQAHIATVEEYLMALGARPDQIRANIGEILDSFASTDGSRVATAEINVFLRLLASTGRSRAATAKEEGHPLYPYMANAHRDVVLGNPGSGKSTLAHKICHDLTFHYADKLHGGRQLTPFLVVLRDYGSRKQKDECSVLNYLELTSNSIYNVPPLPGAFEYLLLNGRLLVIFDGLDELLDTSYRQKITRDIESFCNFYPSVPVLVTSREVGYEQAPLDPQRFQVARLAPFDEDQIAEYVEKWFRISANHSAGRPKRSPEAFLAESGSVPDLRSNPLMLSLMCNLYKGEGSIPSPSFLVTLSILR